MKQVPTKELTERGFLEATTEKVLLLEQTLSFFRVASVAAWMEGWCEGQFSFKKSGNASYQLRGKMNDIFWFTLFHEAGHILNDSKKQTYVDIGYSSDPREESANRFARETLIPKDYNSRLRGTKSQVAVVRLAKELGFAPGILVGRLQHEGILNYKQLNPLKQRFEWSTGT